jgi:hypothetical protein
MIVTKQDKIPIAHKMTRVVHGGRGDYIEIEYDSMISRNIFVPDEQQWRYHDEWKTKVYYFWWSTSDEVKLYLQSKTVSYADYKIGFWYVSPNDVEEVPDD